jgi:HD-like signal output (HDOD) protein
MAQTKPLPLTPAEAEHELADDVLEAFWFGDDDPTRTHYEASKSLSAEVARLRGLKPFPVVAQRVMDLVSDPAVRLDDVRRMLETDPSLCARTLRLANSALYRMGEPCTGVGQALVRLGTKTIYEMMGAVAMLGMFQDVRGVGRTIRDHCVGTAAIGRALVKRNAWHGGAQIFLAGLMHDVGKLLMMQTGELDYSKLPPEFNQVDSVHVFERSQVSYDHAVLGAHVLMMWKIPEFVAQVVAWHHQPARALAAGGDTALMVALVRLADRIEPMLASNTAPTAQDLQALEQTADATYLDLNAQELKNAWPSLAAARLDVLAVFS